MQSYKNIITLLLLLFFNLISNNIQARYNELKYKVFFGFIMRRCAKLKRMYKHYEINFQGTVVVVTG